MLSVPGSRSYAFKRFHGVPPPTASIFSALTASTLFPHRTGRVSSLMCSKVRFSALGELLKAVSAAGCWNVDKHRVTGTGEASSLLRK